MTAAELPTPRSFLTSLFARLAELTVPIAEAQLTNPLRDSDQDTQSLFLTLHCLFPNEFLPALDLLDRQLVTRFVLESLSAEEQGGSFEDNTGEHETVYYVRSSQPARTSRYQSHAGLGGTSYEVRLRAWNCSCPAFTFSAFNSHDIHYDEPLGEDGAISQELEEKSGAWKFGGLMLAEEGLPVCKHLLACVLVESCGTLAGYVDEKVVNREEAAGWAAGWGG